MDEIFSVFAAGFPPYELALHNGAYCLGPTEGILPKVVEMIDMLMAQSQIDIVDTRLAVLRQVLPKVHQLPSTLSAASSGEQKKRMGRWLPYLLEGLEVLGSRPKTSVALQALAASYARLARIKGADALDLADVKGDLRDTLVQL